MTPKRRWTLAALGLLTLVPCMAMFAGPGDQAAPILGLPAPHIAELPRYPITDCHLHLVDFLQNGDDLTTLLQQMDAAGVKQTMVCGMPLVKKWDAADLVPPKRYRDTKAPCYWYSATDALVARAVQSLPAAGQARFLPFLCGFNPTDRNAVDHVARMIAWYPGFWKGIGEIMTRHDDLSRLTEGERPSADHVALDAVYDLAARHGMPVLLHCDLSAAGESEPLYLHELENALFRHPRTRFIWAHAGVSHASLVPTLVPEVRRLLTDYPNLSVDLSWLVYDRCLTEDGKPVRAWVDLLETFPDRFMIGSDIVARFAHYPEKIQRYYVVLDELKPETARKVACDNFLRLLPPAGATPRPAD